MDDKPKSELALKSIPMAVDQLLLFLIENVSECNNCEPCRRLAANYLSAVNFSKAQCPPHEKVVVGLRGPA